MLPWRRETHLLIHFLKLGVYLIGNLIYDFIFSIDFVSPSLDFDCASSTMNYFRDSMMVGFFAEFEYTR